MGIEQIQEFEILCSHVLSKVYETIKDRKKIPDKFPIIYLPVNYDFKGTGIRTGIIYRNEKEIPLEFGHFTFSCEYVTYNRKALKIVFSGGRDIYDMVDGIILPNTFVRDYTPLDLIPLRRNNIAS